MLLGAGHEKEALAAADRVDAERRRGAKLPALAGIPISIKDLFDEAGVVTLGGSTVLIGSPPPDPAIAVLIIRSSNRDCRLKIERGLFAVGEKLFPLENGITRSG